MNHRSLMIGGAAGQLEALLWAPSGAKPAMAAVVCHPHPLFGGTMHNKVVYHAAKTLHRYGLAVLRFNFRGVGLSQGEYDQGRGESEDLRAAIEFLGEEFSGVPLLVAGFSFGAVIGLRVGCAESRVRQLIGLGLPVNDLDTSVVLNCVKPKLLLQGSEDRYGSKENWSALTARFHPDAASQTRVVFIHGADHFFTGRLEEMTVAIAEWLTEMIPALKVREP